MNRAISLLVGVLILGGCHKSFEPEDSTCRTVENDLVMLELESKKSFSNSKRRDFRKLKAIAEDCRKQTSLSERDYDKYIELLNEVESLSHSADDIIRHGEVIHSQRIPSND